MTSELEGKASEYIERIEGFGGAKVAASRPRRLLEGVLAAIENGFIEREISDAAYEYQRRIERKDQIIVGVNDYESKDAPSVEVFEYDTLEEDRQVRRLAKIRSSRNAVDVSVSLSNIRSAANDGQNLMPHTLEASKANASEGEIMDTLKDVYGEYQDPGVF